MANIIHGPTGPSSLPIHLLSGSLSSRELKRHDQTVGRIRIHGQLEAERIAVETHNGMLRARGLAIYGKTALQCQREISADAQLLVELEPGCINGVAYQEQKLAAALGRLTDNVVDRLLS